MIKVQTEALTRSKDEALTLWLAKPEADTLRQVINSKMMVKAAATINESVTADRFQAKLDSANDNLREAQRYATALDVFEEICNEHPHSISKLT